MQRRRFLQTLLAGAGVAVATTARSRGNRDEATAPDRSGRGYRETEHVRRYYATARAR